MKSPTGNVPEPAELCEWADLMETLECLAVSMSLQILLHHGRRVKRFRVLYYVNQYIKPKIIFLSKTSCFIEHINCRLAIRQSILIASKDLNRRIASRCLRPGLRSYQIRFVLGKYKKENNRKLLSQSFGES